MMFFPVHNFFNQGRLISDVCTVEDHLTKINQIGSLTAIRPPSSSPGKFLSDNK